MAPFRNFELNQMDIENVPGRCIYIEEEGVPAYDELIYVANPDRMDRDMLARFMRATELATQYIINNPEESWEVFAATVKGIAERAEQARLARYAAAFCPAPGRL